MYSVLFSLELDYLPTSTSAACITALQQAFISGTGSHEEV